METTQAPKVGVCTPRVTQDLPLRCHRLSPAECFRTFVKAVFYVGKGTRARPYCHLSEALSQYRAGTRKVGWAGDCPGWGARGHGGGHGVVVMVLPSRRAAPRCGASWRFGAAGRASSPCTASRAACRPRRTPGRAAWWRLWVSGVVAGGQVPGSALPPLRPHCVQSRGLQPVLGCTGSLGCVVGSTGFGHKPPILHLQ